MEKHAIIFFSCLTRLTEELLRPGFLNRCVGFLRGLLLAAICRRSWLASLDLWLLCDCMLSSSARCCLEIGQERNHASPSTVTVYKGLGQLMCRHLMKCFDALADWVYILGLYSCQTTNFFYFKSLILQIIAQSLCQGFDETFHVPYSRLKKVLLKTPKEIHAEWRTVVQVLSIHWPTKENLLHTLYNSIEHFLLTL